MNAIIAAATGYGDVDLLPFLVSAERTCAQTTLFLIVFKRDLARVERLRKKYAFIEPVSVRRKTERGARAYRWIARHFMRSRDYSNRGFLWNAFGRYALHIALERYFIASDLLKVFLLRLRMFC